MDRLTRKIREGWGLVEGCELNTPGGMRRVVERLAAYENAGITPEVAAMYAKYHDNRGSVIPYLDELATFRKAQAEGRIVVIPKASKGFKPLVDDAPQDNVSTALNLFYVKDGWTWVRGGGPGPDYADVSLCDYVRQIAKEHSLDIAQSDDDDSISLEMSELLFDGTDTIDGIVATLYTAGWSFAELQERLKAYEKTGMPPEEVAALVTPPNAPLTLDELREIGGEPVWVEFPKCPEASGWMLVDVNRHCVYNGLLGDCDFDNCGKTWLAYRYKLEV